jgi:hypothetical protein
MKFFPRNAAGTGQGGVEMNLEARQESEEADGEVGVNDDESERD